MASFSYVLVDRKGRETRGSIDAETLERASAQLKKDGLMIASIAETNVFGRDIDLSFLQKPPSARDMSVFCRQFVSIINAGVSVVTALEMLGDQTENKRLRAAVIGCRRGIERGESFSAAMREYPKIFSHLFCTLVEAGEASGSLDVSFDRMARQAEKSAKLKATLKKASIYPLIVTIVAIAVVIGLMLFVIPIFEDMFASLGSQLPALTRAIIAFSGFLQRRWYIVFSLIAAAVAGLRLFAKSLPGRRFFGGLTLKLPLIKGLVAKTACASMSRTMSTLISAGIPLIRALDISASVMTNIWFHDALIAARDDVSVGNPLSQALAGTKLFPPLVIHMLGIGEETGDMDGMLSRIADYYEDEVEQTTAQVMSALEPFIMVILALIVGTVVLSMVLPMGSMYSALDNL